MKTILLLLMLSLSMFSATTSAQNADESRENHTEWYEVVTLNGQKTIGILLREDDTSITLELEGVGVITIRRDNIASMTRMDPGSFRDGRYWYPNPNATRYLFAPNALPIGKGTGYYQNTWILFNNFNYGFTERFSLGAGFVPTFLFGTRSLPVWVLPKYALPLGTDRLHVSAGAMLGGIIGEGASGIGLLYGNITYGSRNSNVTLGIGFGYQGDDGLSDTPAINLSGIHRISQNYYVITENYFFSANEDSGSLLSIGMRYAPESYSVDFAIIRPSGLGGDFIGIPWLGVTIPFSR